MKDIEIVFQNKSENLTLKELDQVVNYFKDTFLCNRTYGVCKTNNCIEILDCYGEHIYYIN